MNTAATGYVMPFGKHRGTLLSELDDSYLAWLYSLDDDLRQPLRDWVEQEFQRRRRREDEEFERHQRQTRERYGGNWGNRDRGGPLTENGPPERTTELIDAGFKALAKVHHPDVGGTDAAMQQTLEARAWLLRQVNAALEA